jgi:hypothetical protein
MGPENITCVHIHSRTRLAQLILLDHVSGVSYVVMLIVKIMHADLSQGERLIRVCLPCAAPKMIHVRHIPSVPGEVAQATNERTPPSQAVFHVFTLQLHINRLYPYSPNPSFIISHVSSLT